MQDRAERGHRYKEYSPSLRRARIARVHPEFRPILLRKFFDFCTDPFIRVRY